MFKNNVQIQLHVFKNNFLFLTENSFFKLQDQRGPYIARWTFKRIIAQKGYHVLRPYIVSSFHNFDNKKKIHFYINNLLHFATLLQINQYMYSQCSIWMQYNAPEAYIYSPALPFFSKRSKNKETSININKNVDEIPEILNR